MTVLQLYNAAIAQMSAIGNDSSYQPYKIPFVNQCLVDLFDINNQLLKSKGETELTTIPTVSSDSDNLPYNDTLCRDVMVWKYAQYLISDDNDPRYNVFETEYNKRIGKYNRATTGVITDYYADVVEV